MNRYLAVDAVYLTVLHGTYIDSPLARLSILTSYVQEHKAIEGESIISTL